MKKFYFKAPVKRRLSSIDKMIRVLLFGSFFSFLFATLITGFPLFVFIWNIIFPNTSAQLAKVLSTPINISRALEAEEQLEDNEEEYILPEQDLTLSKEASVRIKKIDVNAEIIEQPLEQYEDALRSGIWRVPNFGTPTDRTNPIILVAHRFGYVDWTQTFRRTHSFYNLPDLEKGDKIEIIWDQRKFEYEIFEQGEGDDITQYDADLILYTCKFLKSDTRIFLYANLVKP